MDTETYLERLAERLQRYGVETARIGAIGAEVESHLTESGEDAVEAFGPPDSYAEHLAASREREVTPGDGDGAAWQHRTFRASAFDEMGILAATGQEGWELVDVAAWALFGRRPWDRGLIQHWEYRRRVGINHDALVTQMRATG